MVPLSTLVGGARRAGSRVHDALQPLPRGRDHRLAGAGLQLRPGARRRSRRSPPRCCRPRWATPGTRCRTRRRRAGGAARSSRFAVLFVFLILAAQYESWSLPFSVLLGTPLAVFGAFLGLLAARASSNNVYAQIGLVMLIGLAAKNAILIVEFAKLELEQGKPLVEAALERRAPAPAPDPDDVVRVHPRLRAAGDRDGRRRGVAPAARHRGDHRHAGRDAARDLPRAGAVRGDRAPDRTRRRARARRRAVRDAGARPVAGGRE